MALNSLLKRCILFALHFWIKNVIKLVTVEYVCLVYKDEDGNLLLYIRLISSPQNKNNHNIQTKNKRTNLMTDLKKIHIFQMQTHLLLE